MAEAEVRPGGGRRAASAAGGGGGRGAVQQAEAASRRRGSTSSTARSARPSTAAPGSRLVDLGNVVTANGDAAPHDRAARPDLRRLHGHRERPAGGAARHGARRAPGSRCACPTSRRARAAATLTFLDNAVQDDDGHGHAARDGRERGPPLLAGAVREGAARPRHARRARCWFPRRRRRSRPKGPFVYVVKDGLDGRAAAGDARASGRATWSWSRRA